MSEPLLRVEDLKVHFPVGGFAIPGTAKRLVRAVNGVSFELKRGETLGLVGESGCGKSTLGRAILHLNDITGGKVTFDGADLSTRRAADIHKLRREAAMIFQDPYNSLSPKQSIGETLAEVLRVQRKVPAAQIEARVRDLAALVGLNPDLLGRKPSTLSGGQCQRVGIARALAIDPQLVIADECVAALDVSIQAQIINLLAQLKRDAGMALLFISHNLSVVRHISDRIMVLYLGKVMELAPRDLFYARPMHPYSQALLSAVPIADPVLERTRQRVRLTGELPSPINPPAGCRLCGRCPKATAICAEQEPPLRDPGDGRLVACHHLD